ncbi:MAG TPA: TlpA disulfide reductase family protein [Chloroflexia bacterium]|nr:TlpA disulfide reductase family protein [Chloroflexia bacterium]
MSNTTYKSTRSRVKDEDMLLDESEDQPVGLFSTPARTAAVISSLVLVLGLFGMVIWLITSRTTQIVQPIPESATANVVSVITKANVGGGEPKRGDKAPDFEWSDVTTGQAMRLSTLGKPAFVNFWGTWCPPCRAEMPEMQRLYNTYKGQIEFIGVSMDGRGDDPPTVAKFINSPPNGSPPIPYTWRFIHDGNYEVATRYQVSAVPSSYFVGTDGVIRAVHIGGMNGVQMEAYLQQLKGSGQ